MCVRASLKIAVEKLTLIWLSFLRSQADGLDLGTMPPLSPEKLVQVLFGFSDGCAGVEYPPLLKAVRQR